MIPYRPDEVAEAGRFRLDSRNSGYGYGCDCHVCSGIDLHGVIQVHGNKKLCTIRGYRTSPWAGSGISIRTERSAGTIESIKCIHDTGRSIDIAADRIDGDRKVPGTCRYIEITDLPPNLSADISRSVNVDICVTT